MSEKVGIFKAIGNYFRDVRSELRKVVYPSAKQVINNTVVVIVAIVVVGLFVSALDGAFSWGRQKLFALTLDGTNEIDWSKYEVVDDGTAGDGANVDPENAMQMYVDENGNSFLLDENGNSIPLDGENPLPLEDTPEVPPADEGSPE